MTTGPDIDKLVSGQLGTFVIRSLICLFICVYTENNNLAECDYEVSPTGCGVRNGAGLICTSE